MSIFLLFMPLARAQEGVASEPSGETSVTIQELVKLSGRAPRYPKAAKDMGLEANCSVKLSIDAEGKVEGVTVQSCPKVFEEEVLTAFYTWKFSPPEMGPVSVVYPVVFTLSSEEALPSDGELQLAPGVGWPASIYGDQEVYCSVSLDVSAEGVVDSLSFIDCPDAFRASVGSAILREDSLADPWLRASGPQDLVAVVTPSPMNLDTTYNRRPFTLSLIGGWPLALGGELGVNLGRLGIALQMGAYSGDFSTMSTLRWYIGQEKVFGVIRASFESGYPSALSTIEELNRLQLYTLGGLEYRGDHGVTLALEAGPSLRWRGEEADFEGLEFVGLLKTGWSFGLGVE